MTRSSSAVRERGKCVATDRLHMNDNGSTPVFLTGYPKSGTTLLLSLLDGHSCLNVFPKETLFFEQAMPELAQDRERGLQRFVERIFDEVLFGLTDVLEDPVDAKEYLDALRTRWHEREYDLGQFIEVAVEAYGELIGRSGRAYWVEKTPHTELYANLIRDWYPNARLIHCLRDPRANYAAVRVWNERERRPAGAIRFLSHWTASCRAAIQNAEVFPQLVLRYEDLVESTERTMRDVCRFLAIPFEPTLLNPTLGGRPFGGNSMFNERYNGVSDASLHRWRSVLSDSETALIETMASREMARFGYIDESTGSTPRMPLARKVAAHAALATYRAYDSAPALLRTTFRTIRQRITRSPHQEERP